MNYFKQILLLAFVMTVNASSDDNEFDYSMTSTCTTQENNMCTVWEHSGSIKQQNSGACFPENSYVITLNGATQMKDLKIGEHLLAYNVYSGETLFSEMTSWFHFVRNETLDYISIITSDGSLTASPSHNVGYVGDSVVSMFTHASMINQYDDLIGFKYDQSNLETINVEEQKVFGFEKRTLMGMYAPYVEQNNYFVSDDGTHFYLVHAYAVVENPLAYEYVVGKTFDMLSGFVHVDESQNVFLNPIAKSLHSVLQLYEDPLSVVRYLRSYSRQLTSKTDDDEQARTSAGYNVLQATDFLTLLAHTHATSHSSYSNSTSSDSSDSNSSNSNSSCARCM